jgi:hypothetical protein
LKAQGGKVTEYIVYHVSKNAYVEEVNGGIRWPVGDAKAEKIKHVKPRK